MSPADLRRRNSNPKTTLIPICLSLRNNTACCIPLRDLRNLRENIHMRVLNLLAQIKPQKSPADLADLRRQNTNSKTTITAIISQPSPTCLSLRNNAACCIRLRDLRYLRENIHMRVLNQSTQTKPQKSPADPADNRRQNPKQQ